MSVGQVGCIPRGHDVVAPRRHGADFFKETGGSAEAIVTPKYLKLKL